VAAWPTANTGGNHPSPGTEVEHLVAALDRLRTTFRWKADDLDSVGLQTKSGVSSLTMAGLLKHLARADEQMFSTKLSGAPLGAPWDSTDWDTGPDWDFNSAANDTPEELYAIWDSTVDRSRARLAAALAGTRGTPTCSARPSTDWWVKTLRLDGTQNPTDHS